MSLTGKGIKDSVLNGIIEIDKTNTDVKINGTLTVKTYTTAERDAISSPVAGMVIFNSFTAKLNFYNGSAWQATWQL